MLYCQLLQALYRHIGIVNKLLALGAGGRGQELCCGTREEEDMGKGFAQST